jgi:hypothetical protein
MKATFPTLSGQKVLARAAHNKRKMGRIRFALNADGNRARWLTHELRRRVEHGPASMPNRFRQLIDDPEGLLDLHDIVLNDRPHPEADPSVSRTDRV